MLAGVLDDLPDASTVLGRFAGHLLVEGVLAHARLDLAAAVVTALGDDLWTWLELDGRPHPFGAVTQVCRVRVLAFRGELEAAGRALSAVPVPPPGPVGAVVAATGCLVRGNQSGPADVRRLVAEVDRQAQELRAKGVSI